jgi:hypothetical protein
VIFLIGLSGCVLLGLLLWRHCELFFGWNHGRRQCWGGVWKSDGFPEHKIPEWMHRSHEEIGDKKSPKACTSLKSCESLYMCPRTLFYRETKDFYILKLPSNLKNISSVNMYMNVFYIPWFAGLISYIYGPATSSHFKPRLFEMTSLTWPLIDSRGLFLEDLDTSRLVNLRLLNLPEVH